MIQRSQKKILRKNIKKCFLKKFPFTKISKFHFLCHSTLVKQKFILLLYFPINFHRIHSRTFINSHPTHPHVSVCVRERMKIPQKKLQPSERKERRERDSGWCEVMRIFPLSIFYFFRDVCREDSSRDKCWTQIDNESGCGTQAHPTVRLSHSVTHFRFFS